MFGFLFAAAVIVIVLAQNQPINGERFVSGTEPLEQNTVLSEEICASLDLPHGSSRLQTRVLSKSDSGVVSTIYSTDQGCLDVDAFFKAKLPDTGWAAGQSDSEFWFFFLLKETRSEFFSRGFSVSVEATEIKSYRGIRSFSLSCSWHR